MKDFIYHSILNFISREHGFFYTNDLVVGRICNQGGRGKVVVVKCFKSKLAYWYKLSIWLRVDCAPFFGLMFFQKKKKKNTISTNSIFFTTYKTTFLKRRKKLPLLFRFSSGSKLCIHTVFILSALKKYPSRLALSSMYGMYKLNMHIVTIFIIGELTFIYMPAN